MIETEVLCHCLMNEHEVVPQIKERFENALNHFIEKLKPDPNIIAVILYGSLANDTVWEKSDMDLNVLVREIKLSTTSFCVEEDGIILNVDVVKAFNYKRMLEKSHGDIFFHSMYSKAKVVYTTDASIHDFLNEARKIGSDDRALSFFTNATYLIGCMEKIEKWLMVKNNLLYAQFWILKGVDNYANMRLILDEKLPSREAVLKVMEYAPELIHSIYERPMNGFMSREEIIDSLNFFRKFLENNIELIKQPVVAFMSDGEVRTVTQLVKRFRIDSHGIYHIFDFLAEMGVVGRVTEYARITPKSKMAIEEVAFMYMEGMSAALIGGIPITAMDKQMNGMPMIAVSGQVGESVNEMNEQVDEKSLGSIGRQMGEFEW